MRPATWVLVGGMLLLAFGWSAGCKLDDASPGPVTGPSELGTSITLSVNPEQLPKDGTSVSIVTIVVRGPDGQPIANLAARVETCAVRDTDDDGVDERICFDLGTLSARRIVTDGAGHASVSYTAPVDTDPSITLRGRPESVFIRVTPDAGDFGSALPREVVINLLPPGAQLPPASTPVAAFTVTPTSPTAGQAASFDGSASRNSAAASPGENDKIVSYQWDFGDGTTGTGMITTHTYTRADVFIATLTVSNGVVGDSTSTPVTVAVSIAPTASFTITPAAPGVAEKTFFNASGSTAASGRSIGSYLWTFSNGATGTGMTHTRSFGTAGTLQVTLTVTDDLGKTGVSSQTFTVGGVAPKAVFTISPTDPAAGATVFFNGSQSTASGGATIASYTWNFGDSTGTTVTTGAQTSHAYAAAGTFTATLTVTDSEGRTAVATLTIKVV